MKNNKLFDFEVNINEEREFRILQMTDFQPIDPSQQRYEGRLKGDGLIPLTDERMNQMLYYYMDKLVNEQKPDLIIVTGDQIYGEFDDNGSIFLKIINHLNNYNVPWAPVYGNHDAESKMGVAWQCKQYESMSNCLFKRRELSGNGNYNIGLFVNGKLIKVLYMMDSNGCGHGTTYSYVKDYPPYNLDERMEPVPGIHEDQLQWIEKSVKEIEKYYQVNNMIAFHIPPDIISKIAYKKHYQSTEGGWNRDQFIPGVTIDTLDNDFGEKMEPYYSFETGRLWNVLKENRFTNLFLGHCHLNSLVMMCDGVRISFGLKTGLFDYHNKIGGTLITLKNKEVNIEHKYIDILE